MNNLIKYIDFCVALSGPNVEILCKLFFKTLRNCCNLDGILFHLVNKDVPDRIMEKVMPLLDGLTVSIHPLPFLGGNYDKDGIGGDDVAATCDYMLKKCGQCKWAYLSHFDLWFKKDWLLYARNLIADDVAIIGSHCPIMLVNRDAYLQSRVKFMMMNGMDTGIALREEMRGLGWGVETFPELNKDSETLQAQEWFHHIGGGGTHYSEPEVGDKWRFCEEKLKELGIQC